MFKLLKEKLISFIKGAEETAKSVGGGEKAGELEVKLSAATKVRGLLSGGRITFSENDLEDLLWKLQLDLVQSDVALETAESITTELKERLLGNGSGITEPGEHVKKVLREILAEILKPECELDLLDFIRNSEKPVKIVFFGVNGTGKTTTIAKVARYLTDNKFGVVLAAGDTFRAGAIEQLQKHGEALGVRVVAHKKGGDSTAVIYDAVEHAKSRRLDVVLADTAGRMQTNRNLMDEMEKICRVIKPDLRIFVGDSLTGNDAISQVREFNETVGIDAVILSKMDADAKGGCALSIAYETRKPIIFVGVGQQYSDLTEFDRNWFIENIT